MAPDIQLIMRKRIVDLRRQTAIAVGEWLDLDRLAIVEVTSEAACFPVENALRSGTNEGWRAAQPGAQTIRLVFDEPQDLSRIYLAFLESETARTQEFVLRWSGDRGNSFHDIVRQQWNFNPACVREEENYQVEIPAATVLELTIIPDISRQDARASLLHLRVA